MNIKPRHSLKYYTITTSNIHISKFYPTLIHSVWWNVSNKHFSHERSVRENKISLRENSQSYLSLINGMSWRPPFACIFSSNCVNNRLQSKFKMLIIVQTRFVLKKCCLKNIQLSLYSIDNKHCLSVSFWSDMDQINEIRWSNCAEFKPFCVYMSLEISVRCFIVILLSSDLFLNNSVRKIKKINWKFEEWLRLTQFHSNLWMKTRSFYEWIK